MSLLLGAQSVLLAMLTVYNTVDSKMPVSTKYSRKNVEDFMNVDHIGQLKDSLTVFDDKVSAMEEEIGKFTDKKLQKWSKSLSSLKKKTNYSNQ